MKGSATGALSGEDPLDGAATEASEVQSPSSTVVDATGRDMKLAIKQSFNDMRPLRPSTWFGEDDGPSHGADEKETVEVNEAAMKAKLKEIREQKKKEAQAKKAAKIKGKGKGESGAEEKPKKKKTEEASKPHPQNLARRRCKRQRSGRTSKRKRLIFACSFINAVERLSTEASILGFEGPKRHCGSAPIWWE